ncbi:hypothetical protein SCLCIDRAFT_33933 [Scleroderma citrinum Foug A]|uniref:Uncharacterized protein n=1 Tax=Scleroderma citrinum Foug A TaxID=1036808 RepID=A0A0C3CQJ2_9AGAM|nr:hypothetical protein SCLCIDRAFT_33933 [Scleroderma citrinum Foug A]
MSMSFIPNRSANDGDKVSHAEPIPCSNRTLGVPQLEDETLPLAQRRPHQLNCQLPLRFQDVLPESPMPLPLSGIQPLEGPSQGASGSHLSHLSPPVSAPCSMFKTQWNKFSLFRVFRSEGLPSHDPDEQSTDMQSFLSQLRFTTNSFESA